MLCLIFEALGSARRMVLDLQRAAFEKDPANSRRNAPAQRCKPQRHSGSAQGKCIDGVRECQERNRAKRCACRVERGCLSAALRAPQTLFAFVASLMRVTRVALAHSIAGKAKKSPPTSGPANCATRSVITVAAPPRAKRTTCSYHRPSFKDSIFALTIMRGKLRKVRMRQRARLRGSQAPQLQQKSSSS